MALLERSVCLTPFLVQVMVAVAVVEFAVQYSWITDLSTTL